MYKTWVVFGFWTIVASSAIQFFSAFFLAQLIGAREEKDSAIIYNPKEWPKFLNFLVSLGIAYYLYTSLSGKVVSTEDYIFAMVYIVVLTVIPTLFSIYKLIRDRNDFIRITDQIIQYKDNAETGEFEFANISKLDYSKNGIHLTFKDETTALIKIGQMNFNVRDALGVSNEIKKRIPKVQEEPNPNSTVII
jgi:uncharacterized protein YxeA